MFSSQPIPIINKDTGRLVYLKIGRLFYESKQVLSLNPVVLSEKAEALALKPVLTDNFVQLKNQSVFTEQSVYLGKLVSWQFETPSLLLNNIIVTDTNLWRRLVGKPNLDMVIARKQIRELNNQKLIVTIDGQLLNEELLLSATD